MSLERMLDLSNLYPYLTTLKCLMAPEESPGSSSFLLEVGWLLPKQTAAKQSVWPASSFVAWTKRVIFESLVHGHRVRGQNDSGLATLQALKPLVPQEKSPPEM